MTKPDETTIKAAMLGNAEAARECTEAGYALPCGHCHRDKIHQFSYLEEELGATIYVCECPCGMSARTDHPGEALAIWNTRADLRGMIKIDGNTSDGYHTYNELYHHRAMLFSVIANERPHIAWKSKLHHDGTMYDGMFIVGINTPYGQATYHYDIDPYWNMFHVRELERAPEWDGHTSEQAIERIAKLDLRGMMKGARE